MDIFLVLQKLVDKMKKQQYYIYLSQLLAGLKSEKKFFIAKNTRAAKQLSSIFIQLGIINYITKPSLLMLSKKTKKKNIENESSYLAFWFKKNQKSSDNKFCISKHRFTKNTFSFHKIKIVSTSTSYQKYKLSYKNLLKYHPYWNTIYIMSTPKGIITSKEAFEQKVGGYILCKIILLFLNF